MTALTLPIRDMIGDQLADAVEAARERTADDTIFARCEAGLWLVERGGDAVASGLDYAGALAATAALA